MSLSLFFAHSEMCLHDVCVTVAHLCVCVCLSCSLDHVPLSEGDAGGASGVLNPEDSPEFLIGATTRKESSEIPTHPHPPCLLAADKDLCNTGLKAFVHCFICIFCFNVDFLSLVYFFSNAGFFFFMLFYLDFLKTLLI